MVAAILAAGNRLSNHDFNDGWARRKAAWRIFTRISAFQFFLFNHGWTGLIDRETHEPRERCAGLRPGVPVWDCIIPWQKRS